MNRVTIQSMLKALDAAEVEYNFFGDKEQVIISARSMSEFSSGCVSFYRGVDFSQVRDLRLSGGLLIVKREIAETLTEHGNILITDNPDLVFCIAAKLLYPRYSCGIHPSSMIHENAEISIDAHIGENACIGEGVVVAQGVVVEEGVILKNCSIGAGSHIYPGVKIGSSGLGSHRDHKGQWHHFPHFGRVAIGCDVTIQDNCVIARGTLQDTVIEDGVCIGPQSWIAHGAFITRNAFIAQAVTIAGSVVVEEGAIIWGHAAIRDGIRIGKRAVVGMGAVVIKDVPAGATVIGNPAKPK